MTKAYIEVLYDGETYTSKCVGYTSTEIEDLYNFVEKVVGGDLTYLMLDSEDGKIYFPANIISQSIITVLEL